MKQTSVAWYEYLVHVRLTHQQPFPNYIPRNAGAPRDVVFREKKKLRNQNNHIFFY